ncbi:hypothetical protein GWK91_12780 [Virgibacillus sp. MSP4-1]|uniref:hypothetical protein n=1 Tax=Virgibacillus sp. MSP4-1 TaxID=2700081 RepID=UPI0003A31C07|nr:hypothetical protein [Virgibacillus sp. MSP4-1]QHS23769.1 hypothetical protein GWK91_12780 [Virgibacillus sp. MSP4-1]
MNTNNIIAKALYVIGILEIVAGIILGIAFGNVEVDEYFSSYNEFSWSIFFMWSIAGTVSGVLFIGFSEVIKILENMANRVLRIDSKVEKIEKKLRDEKR